MEDKQDRQSERKMAIEKARAWWKDKNPNGRYVCDACNGPLEWNEEGSSLIGDWMRCKNCTDRTFFLLEHTVKVSSKKRNKVYHLSDLLSNSAFSDNELLQKLSDLYHDPTVLKFRVKRLPTGDIEVSKRRFFRIFG